MTRRRRNTEHAEKKRWPMLILASCLASFLTIGVLLLACAALMMKVDLPDTALKALGMVIPGISGLVTGLIVARMEGSRGLLIGFMSCIPAGVVLLISNLFMHPNVFSISIWLKIAILLICGAIGGVFGVNMRKRLKV